MQHLTKLFKLIELTRSQPQYGYALTGIPKHDLSDLAAHHYLVAFMAWQIARELNRAGAKLNVEKVLEFSLTHDLGELFGGDISMPYAAINPRARRLAKAFEEENQRFFARFFGEDRGHIKALTKEILSAKSDEALVCKVADYLECTHYKLYVGYLHDKRDIPLNVSKLAKMVAKIKDKVAKRELAKFLKEWAKELLNGDTLDVLWEKAKKKK
ncbi:HD domain-containing protein [Candidatus Uhrbacteria bacterium]|nr:HD domain-containing protein [Candidatus Uhrbacteria bacterium]